MRDSVLGFNQNKAVQAKLDLTDLMLLQYIMLANGTPDMKHIVKDNISYVWLSHSKIQEDLPILNIAEGTLRNKLYDLKKNNWIASETVRTSKGATTYYSISIKAMSLINDKDTENEEPCHSEMTCPCHSKMTSDNKLKDNKLNNNFTNVKLEQPTVTPIQSKRRIKLVDTPNGSVNEDTANQDKPKKKSRYEQCLDVIDDTIEARYTDLKQILADYLTMRLAIKDKPMYVSGWKALIRKLKELSSNTNEQYEIVRQSLENSWATFYPLKSNYKRIGEQDQSVFSEYGKVKSEHRENEVVLNVSF